MKKGVKIYHYSLLGAFGGVTGWFIISFFSGIQSLSREISKEQALLIEWAIYGSILGGSIGISMAAYEGFSSRSFVRFVGVARRTMLYGALGGLLSFPFVQFLYKWALSGSNPNESSATPATFLTGLGCWVLFGSIIGFIETIGKGSQPKKGAYGGALGGFVGGIVYEIARANGSVSSNQLTSSDYWVQAVSFLILGGAIGGSISFITNVFNFAKVIILDGKFAGQEINVTKYVNPKSRKEGYMGADPIQDNVFIPGDTGILKRHAILCFEDGAPRVKISKGAEKVGSEVFVNNRSVKSWPLNSGDRIRLGYTNLLYEQERKAEGKNG